MQNEKHLIQNIINLAKQNNYSYTDLADYIGVTRSAVAQWLEGKRHMNINVILKFAKLFNVSVDSLLNSKTSKNILNADSLHLNEHQYSSLLQLLQLPLVKIFLNDENKIYNFINTYSELLTLSSNYWIHTSKNKAMNELEISTKSDSNQEIIKKGYNLILNEEFIRFLESRVKQARNDLTECFSKHFKELLKANLKLLFSTDSLYDDLYIRAHKLEQIYKSMENSENPGALKQYEFELLSKKPIKAFEKDTKSIDDYMYLYGPINYEELPIDYQEENDNA